jgi:acetoin utilization deacetylase AcuC-like enzyme
MTLLIRDPLFQRHDTGRHPERAARLQAIDAAIERAGLVERCRPISYTPLTAEQTAAVHAPHVAQNAKQLAVGGGGWLEADTFVSPPSFDVALAAAGACVSAVDAVLDGVEKNALCLVRPPGHHATPTRSMGFCLFNNVALAARHAVSRGVSRVLILDWDVHHGNGTQDVFYADGQVTFLSVHRFGNGFYPGTGDADENGTGAGLGHTLNAPLRYGISRAEYRAAFRSFVEKAAELSRPELVLLSAGFDAHAADPIGSLGLEVEDYVDLTTLVLDVADAHARGRLVSCLEGGYNLDALAQSVQAHLETMLDAGT